jgi:hypothetical protein
MDAKRLVELRREAEQAVSEMPDGDLKIKAFEVILNHLLQGPERTQSGAAAAPEPRRRDTKGTVETSTIGRILVLRDEGFFKSQRAIGEVREELRAHGWHYPVTSLSPALLTLVQQRKLRRERGKEGNKKIWKYSNP